MEMIRERSTSGPWS